MNHIDISIAPILRPIPVILWNMEKTAVKTFLWIDKCGDNGLFSNLLDIEYVIYDYIFSQKIQNLKFLSIVIMDIL